MRLIKEDQTNWKLQDLSITVSKCGLKYEWAIEWCNTESYAYEWTQIKITKRMIYESDEVYQVSRNMQHSETTWYQNWNSLSSCWNNLIEFAIK
jgi:hypothetical protein